MRGKIETYSGKIFDLLDPKPEMVCIEDIIHSLANICRYAGHVQEFYSVAEHSVRMAMSPVFSGKPLARLMHDAAEAYIGDIASPWKQMLNVELDIDDVLSVKEFESRILTVICKALDLRLTNDDFLAVKEADNRMYATEVRDLTLIPDDPVWCIKDIKPLEGTIIPWSSEEAAERFRLTYDFLRRTEC